MYKISHKIFWDPIEKLYSLKIQIVKHSLLAQVYWVNLAWNAQHQIIKAITYKQDLFLTDGQGKRVKALINWDVHGASGVKVNFCIPSFLEIHFFQIITCSIPTYTNNMFTIICGVKRFGFRTHSLGAEVDLSLRFLFFFLLREPLRLMTSS